MVVNLHATTHRLLQLADQEVCCSSSTACSSLQDAWLLSEIPVWVLLRCNMLAIPLTQHYMQELKTLLRQGLHKGLLHDLLAKPSM